MFFMSFLKSKKKRIDYAGIYEAAALTPAPADWKEFLNQRIRWVSKSRYYSDPAIILAALLVAITNASLVVLLLCIPFFPTAGYYITAGYLIKTCIDFPLLYMAARRFKQKNIMPVYPPAQFFYPIFVTFVSIYGNFGKYTWKQRSSQRMGPK
jgi:cellulose synthase/poly-beta-1,6-N-acetylglucosamine synthase-like glycosyltransferase